MKQSTVHFEQPSLPIRPKPQRFITTRLHLNEFLTVTLFELLPASGRRL